MHSVLGGSVLAIEDARTHAHDISTGAVAVFREFRPARGRAEARGVQAETPEGALLRPFALSFQF